MHVDYRVTITQTGKHQTTLFVLSVSTDPSLHCLLVCLVVKYPVHNEFQNLGPSVSRCGEYTALCCNCDSTRTSILSVSVLTTSLEISPPPPSALHLFPFPPPLSLSLSLPPPLTFSLFSRRTCGDSNLRAQIRRERERERGWGSRLGCCVNNDRRTKQSRQMEIIICLVFTINARLRSVPP